MATVGIDGGKAATDLLTKAVEAIVTAGAVRAGPPLRRLYHALTNAYGPFMEQTYARVGRIRTLLQPDASVDLLGHYVAPRLGDGGREIDLGALIDWLSDGARLVVSGLAGRGKSALMKYVALSLYHAPRGKIPLVFELRQLNGQVSKDVLRQVHAQYAGDSGVSFDDFREALRRGWFILLLDGFDEVAPVDRAEVERQIVDLSFAFETCPVLVSGRPCENYATWERFTVLQLKPMTLDRTIELIGKSDHDEAVRQRFLAWLTPGNFHRHKSFLETPLLALMMMLTFGDHGEIPRSLHAFYGRTFDTLGRRHDALKFRGLRQTHSGCSAEEFERILAGFCLLTHLKSAFTFDRRTAIGHLRTALRQQGLDASAELVLTDLVESLCILQVESFDISFVHRSFQEYFAALYLTTAPAGLVRSYLDRGKISVPDGVLPLLWGMASARVEAEWALQTVDDILARFPDEDPASAQRLEIEAFDRLDVDVHAEGLGGTSLRGTRLWERVKILRNFYPERFEVAEADAPPSIRRHSNWPDRVWKELVALERAGEPGLEGFAKAPARLQKRDAERPKGAPAGQGGGASDLPHYAAVERFSIDLSPRHRELVHTILARDRGAITLDALREIRRIQRARAKGEDAFAAELFAAGGVGDLPGPNDRA